MKQLGAELFLCQACAGRMLRARTSCVRSRIGILTFSTRSATRSRPLIHPAGSPPQRGFLLPARWSLDMDAELVKSAGDEVLSPEQFCVLAQISYDTLQRFRRRGEGPKEIKIGSTTRFLKSDSLEWLKSLRQN
jgi:predicted DNA-binding transcriptional regulator AlpA